jgi:hypothetical protein
MELCWSNSEVAIKTEGDESELEKMEVNAIADENLMEFGWTLN